MLTRKTFAWCKIFLEGKQFMQLFP